jgi:hypothetical protein
MAPAFPRRTPDHVDAGRHRLDVVVGWMIIDFTGGGNQLFVGVGGRVAVVVELVVVPALGLLFHDVQCVEPLHGPVARPAGHQQAHRGAVECSSNWRYAQARMVSGMRRLLDGQAFIVIERFRALGSRGGTPMSLPSARVERSGGQAGFMQDGSQGHPVHSLALRIMHSLVREAWCPHLEILEERGVAARTLITVRTLRPGKRRN